MKQRSTTPVSKSFVAKASLVAAAVLMAIAGPVQIGSVARADKYDDQINAIRSQMDGYQSEVARLQGEADTLQGKLSQLASEKSAIQAQIDINQVKYDQLIAKIAETEKKIKDNQDALGETLANLYVDDNISPLEMLASSNNIGDYLDKQEYRNSIRDTLTQKIGEIKKLKEDLDKQKADVEKVLSEQKDQGQALSNTEGEQQKLLDQTKGQESAYGALVDANKKQIEELHAQQAAENARRLAQSGSNLVAGDPGKGGYPSQWANAPQDSMSDDWGMFNRECVSYVAWKVYSSGKYMPPWGRMYPFPYGSAKYWPNYSSNRSSVPSVNTAAVMTGGETGHVAWVENVYTKGGQTWVHVSQYNYSVDGRYSEMDVPASFFNTYISF